MPVEFFIYDFRKLSKSGEPKIKRFAPPIKPGQIFVPVNYDSKGRMVFHLVTCAVDDSEGLIYSINPRFILSDFRPGERLVVNSEDETGFAMQHNNTITESQPSKSDIMNDRGEWTYLTLVLTHRRRFQE